MILQYLWSLWFIYGMTYYGRLYLPFNNKLDVDRLKSEFESLGGSDKFAAVNFAQGGFG